MNTIQTRKRCPVCEEEVETRLVEISGEYSIFECCKCKLEFAHPLYYNRNNYDKGYRGEKESNTFIPYDEDLSTNLKLMERGIKFGHTREQFAIKWLRSNIPASSYVLDLGCGGGRFLALLRKYRFHPLGIDVASEPIRMLREKGFQVASSSIEDYPAQWPVPAAITLFEVLEHLPDPLGFLKKIIIRFPEAPLILSVPSPMCFRLQNSREEYDYPPHHLTRWSEDSLFLAFSRAGYRSTILFPGISSADFTGSGIGKYLRKTFLSNKEINKKTDNVLSSGNSCSQPILVDNLLFKIKSIVYWPYTKYLTLRGYSKHMIGIGIPCRQEICSVDNGKG